MPFVQHSDFARMGKFIGVCEILKTLNRQSFIINHRLKSGGSLSMITTSELIIMREGILADH